MASLALNTLVNAAFGRGPADRGAPAGDYGAWTDYRIPDDRGEWHPLMRRFYDYWLSIAPPGGLPGRQHVAPEKMTAWLSRLWLLDVHRDPLRFRCRLAGSEMVRSIGQEVTGGWLDEVHPQSVTNPDSRNRFRVAVELARPTWRRGPLRWARQPDFKTVESCIVPLARDGRTVDKLMAMSIVFDAHGRQV
jgi:PAS domain